MSSSSSIRFRIGYALSPKKEKTFITPSLLDYAKLHGIDLVRIDPHFPLLQQAPFHCIIHKLYDESWVQKLRDFTSICPDVVVVDPPELISPLLNRVSMLEVVKEVKIPQGIERIESPKQIVVYDLESVHAFRDLGIEFPVIAKPLESNGSAKSHELFLVSRENGLKGLKSPIVLQEFVNHSGVVFKVYVVGECVVSVTRRSLPDISEEELGKMDAVTCFSRISNSAGENNGGDGNSESNVLMPPFDFVMNVAGGLREAMGLRLFNFDMIRDARDRNRYLVIDINYLPGYAKMPNYEAFLTKFFVDVIQSKNGRGESSSYLIEGQEMLL